jgi:hypothetical protein
MKLTNRGKFLIQGGYFLADGVPTTFYCALIDSGSTAPSIDTNTMSQLTEVSAGNGYTSGGVAVPRQTGGGASVVQDNTANTSTLTLADIAVAEASGGTIPSTGTALYAVLTTDEATVADRQIIAYTSLGSARSCPDGKIFKLTDHQIIFEEPT